MWNQKLYLHIVHNSQTLLTSA